MKFLSGLMVMCLLIIGFNLALGLYGAINDNYDPAHTQRAAQFAIVLVPLTAVWCAMSVGNRVVRSVGRKAKKR